MSANRDTDLPELSKCWLAPPVLGHSIAVRRPTHLSTLVDSVEGATHVCMQVGRFTDALAYMSCEEKSHPTGSRGQETTHKLTPTRQIDATCVMCMHKRAALI